MTCGISGEYKGSSRPSQETRSPITLTQHLKPGAGKSTLSKAIISSLPSFVRLSVDALIYEKHGLYTIDYRADKYAQYQDEAKVRLSAELLRLLREKQRDIILDLSFWNKGYRDKFKGMVEQNGGQRVLVFLDAGKDVLRQRIAERRARRDALGERDESQDGDSAFNVDEETFERFCGGFEKPVGEGEVAIKVV
ncbi:hypothetical protein TOPH_07783 [Tolypocladium ophioglossoides CBS 100239]|uniref:ATP/GTP-binding protein n=1 Tax=Tolypocladium ophioglossoides (strain CBS 100239) TaxID=1163406 RepID=A0A0L0N0H5_TOLOC|nr:hypothetical protein TOPH_07783 [Tolypocladium ophioglossoides CBS 100239]